MTIKFRHSVKHGVSEYLPTVPLAFEDEHAELYFIAAGFADETPEAPLHTYPEGTVQVDPETVFANSNTLVLGGMNNG